MNAKHAKQLQEAPRGNRSAANDPDDQARYLRSKSRQRDQLLRQFCGDGPRGNSQAYLDGWERIWGKKEGQA